MQNFSSSMEKEIYEQPSIIKNILKTYISENNEILVDNSKSAEKICFIASGSSYHCCFIAAEMMKTSLGLDAEAFYSGEFYTLKKANWEKQLFVFVSQSGETSDTLSVMKRILKYTDNTLVITNTKNSTMWNLAKHKIYTMAGIENSIASTKALTAQLICSILLILSIQQQNGENISDCINELKQLPEFIEKQFQNKSKIKEIGQSLSKFDSIEVLGTRIFYGLAKEGALKIKETSYINTTAYPLGEFMHGHVAILNRKSAVIVLVDEINHDVAINNIRKIYASYNPYLITIADEKAPEILNSLSKIHISLKTKSEILSIFGMLVILQLLALECAQSLGRNIDKPIGLSKVVTINQ
jgi:glucosamine--fructose-6-phosphate aminotransferase (isomerizing)